ncbi:MAG TPA: hypothetical protein PLP17_10915, partial [Oligoflexia bacterium]|nr:hypothetical protein [Oligoflexia bacterium]
MKAKHGTQRNLTEWFGLRLFIVATQGLYPFSLLYRLFYRFALRFFLYQAKKDRAITAVFLRHLCAASVHDAGLTDIDLSITMRSTSIAETLEHLQRFWRKYETWRRLFPMIGEIELFHSEDFLPSVRLASARAVVPRKHSVVFLSSPAADVADAIRLLAHHDGGCTERSYDINILHRYILCFFGELFNRLLTPSRLGRRLLEHAAHRIVAISALAAPGKTHLITGTLHELPEQRLFYELQTHLK